MIVFFGPPGAGKSVQGQLLAVHRGWRWLSTGQLIRDGKDPRLLAITKKGDLLSDDDMNGIIANAIKNAANIEDLILDGYPRKLDQARWLIQNLPSFKRRIDAVISLQVSDEELAKRLQIRGRVDDSPERIAKRSKIYHDTTEPVIDYLQEQGVCIERVNGEGTLEEVQARVEKAVQTCLGS